MRRLGRLVIGVLAASALAITAAVTPIATAPAEAAPTTAQAATAQAISGGDFNPGMIISDQVFFYGNSMSAPEIQAFLNSKVPNCAIATCLKTYRENTRATDSDPMCSALPAMTGISAAEIIYFVGKACGINPQVIIATLQKEQGLVLSTAPSDRAFRVAMGYACPDTAPCDAQFYGFFNQVYKGAWQLKRYGAPPGTGPGTPWDYNYNWYPVGRTTAVRYHPNAACGTLPVTIQNKATAALYYYTPYTPNASALANLTGTGDSCGSYGNRNFWVYFTNWFGPTAVIPGSSSFVTAAYFDVLGRGPGADEVTWWAVRLGRVFSRTDVANGFNNSDEYRNRRIAEAYQAALGRAPDAAGAAFWLNLMQRGVVQPDDAYRTFLASDEMYLRGGNTIPGYITLVYNQILHRDPDPTGMAFWSARLAAGEQRATIANDLWNSVETAYVRVDDTYVALLGRHSSVADQQSWAVFASRFGQTAMRANIMSSDEYFTRALARYPS